MLTATVEDFVFVFVLISLALVLVLILIVVVDILVIVLMVSALHIPYAGWQPMPQWLVSEPQ